MPESDVQETLILSQRKQRRPGPDTPRRGISPEQWPDVLRRIEQGDSLRQVASDYGVSYETIRRAVQKARKLEAEGS